MLHAFDLDHTLLKGNSSFHFYFYLLAQRFYPFKSLYSSSWLYLKYRFLRMELRDLHKAAFSLFLKGISEKQLAHLGVEFVEKYWAKMQNTKVTSLLRAAQNKAHFTLILSSSPSFLVEPFAKKFCVSSFQGTEYLVDQEDKINQISSLMIGQNKAKALHSFAKKAGILLSDTIAYSDSFSDLPFLESAGKKIAIDPDARLYRICQEKGWEVLS